MQTFNVALLFLAAFATTFTLAAPLSARATDVRVPSDTNPTNPQIMGSYVAARSEDGSAAPNDLFTRMIPVIKNKHEKMGNSPAGSSGSQEMQARDLSNGALDKSGFGPHQSIHARGWFNTLVKVGAIYKYFRGMGVIFHRRKISPTSSPLATSWANRSPRP